MNYSREYWIWVLLLGLSFYTDRVHCDDPTNSPTDNPEEDLTHQLNDVTSDITSNVTTQLKEMEERIGKLEMLLYKVLAASDNDNRTSSINKDVCTLDSCPKEGDIKCTSIDLLHSTSDCQICVQGDWRANIPCKRQYESKKFTIHNEGNNIDIVIDEKGGVSGTIIKETDSNCVWSQYTYTNIGGTEKLLKRDGHKQLLFCKSEKKDFHEQFYCLRLKDGDNNKDVCYEKKGSCSLNDDKLSCDTKGHELDKNITTYHLIHGEKCTQLKKIMEPLEPSECNITIATDNDDNIIFNKDGKHNWDKDKVNITITCSETIKCSSHVNDICSQNSNVCNLGDDDDIPASTTDTTINTTPSGSDNDDSSSSTLYLIIIIVILVVLLISYCGYQNQWHHKLSNFVNGTEGEAARPKPSSGRGRMKGKYAPLPRSMEETLPRHDD